MERMLAIYIYIGFRSLWSSELSCVHYNENADKPWIRQSFFTNVSKVPFCQSFLLPKFFTIQYVVYEERSHVEFWS